AYTTALGSANPWSSYSSIKHTPDRASPGRMNPTRHPISAKLILPTPARPHRPRPGRLPMHIDWTDADPETGEKRFVRAEKFARQWRFMVRFRRRTEWDRAVVPTREMWETLLDALERRYRRREGVTDDDLAAVRKVIAGLRPE